MTEAELLLFLIYGVILGARHAVEPDHLAAVSTMAAHGRSRREIIRLAGAWGAGHATLIAIVGTLLILLPWQPPEWFEHRAEALVGLLMVAMGCYVLWNIRRSTLHLHSHRHDGRPEHAHFHLHQHGADHRHPPAPSWLRRPLAAYLVGTVHGLAGSGAAIALAVAAASSREVAVLYLVLFALGSIAGMAATAALALWPIVFLSARFSGARQLVQKIAGGTSLAIGLLLIYGTFSRI
ncbi:MAG: hypothetical protein WD314_02570 [Trueperaceae bacterium]